uniref:Replication factor A C-terminal domain-containing protein n=1 Tax=Salix viminalis TaxID=40686 RepID=A0A6N2MU44_SALVM
MAESQTKQGVLMEKILQQLNRLASSYDSLVQITARNQSGGGTSSNVRVNVNPLFEGHREIQPSEGCQKNDAECSLRYIMVVKVSDGSGEGGVSSFNEEAEKIIGCSADELDLLKSQMGEENSYQLKLKEATWTPHKLSIKYSPKKKPAEKKPAATEKAPAETKPRAGKKLPKEGATEKKKKKTNEEDVMWIDVEELRKKWPELEDEFC